jgi:putative transcriptional regulator
MKVLRDLRLGTKLLILLEAARDPNVKLKSIAGRLDMTVQGVSEYMRRMRDEGLIHEIGGYRPTKKGVQFLHENLRELREFVEDSWKEAMIITSCSALAMTEISKGGEVGLFMENGILRAYSGKRSSSTGIADSDAGAGEIVVVKELEGIVDLRPGKIHMLNVHRSLLSEKETGKISDLKRRIGKVKGAIVAVHGLEAQVLADRLGLKVDARFGSIESAIEACQKGLDVLLLVSSEFADDVLNRVKEENSLREDRIVVADL